MDEFTDEFIDDIRQHHTAHYRCYQRWLIYIRKQFEESAPWENQRMHSAARYAVERDIAERAGPPKDDKDELIFITISPEHSVKFDDFKEAVERFMKRTVFDKHEAIYTYEQTGETKETMGYHIHCHILCKKKVNTSPAKYTQMIKETFKYIKHIADVKKYPFSYYNEKSDYLHGKKWDKAKENALVINTEWRAHLGLKNIYTI